MSFCGRRAITEWGNYAVVEISDPELALCAAHIKHAYWVSLGDAYAAATAIRHDAELWTGDTKLLCEDSVWRVRDLRSDNIRHQHAQSISVGKRKTGRRPGTFKYLPPERRRTQWVDRAGCGFISG